MLKVRSIILLSLLSVALCEDEIELNEKGCPTDNLIYKILPHENCNKFYKCSNGEPVEFQCPETLMFNLEETTCSWPRDVDCGSRRKEIEVPEINEESNDPTAFCAKQGSDGMLVAHEYCNYLYMCVRGVPLEIQCPNQLMFNADSKFCDSENQVDCGDRLREKEDQEDDSEAKK